MRILMRGYKHPLRRMRPEAVLDTDVLGKNSGNLVFSEASFRALSMPGTEVTVSNFEDLFDDVDRVNAEYDAVALPFANAFRGSYLPTLERFTEFVRGLRIPVTVLGIGAQSDLDYRLGPLAQVNDAAKAFTAAVLDKSPTIGVRGEFSATYLRSLGFDAVDVIGCPSMFMFGSRLPTTRDPGPLHAGSRIALNLTPGAGRPGLVQHHLERYPELVYIAQGNFDLRLMLWGVPVRNLDDEYPRTLDHPLFAEDRARMFVDVSTWIEELRRVDFSFGTRIHGNVAALLAGTPAHVIAHDSRTRELAEYFDIPYTRQDRLPEDVDAKDLLAGSSYAALHAGHGARFTRFTDYLRVHGLGHSLDDTEAAVRMDRRVQKLKLPSAVRAANGAGAAVLLQRAYWSHQANRREAADLERRVAELEHLLANTSPDNGLRARLRRRRQG
ncbi:MAG: polysaccharide pyruvyl transferase family protein [Actinomycetota bacterium]|nr:polysaccharide pyruvyl transferase family protein [Actinomycetota bacterium]